MLKGMIGMQLGDPSLAGILPGRGLAVVVLDPANSFTVIEVEQAQSAAHAGALSAKGLVTKYDQGVLIAGKTAG